MKSRRRIAFSKAQDCADYRSQRIRLQQGFATGEMGSNDYFAAEIGLRPTLGGYGVSAATITRRSLAPCIRHTFQPRTAGERKGCPVRFDLTAPTAARSSDTASVKASFNAAI
jgi:hypothetical protein